MTNWRERGYVPASDGDDSESDLSTQESESLKSPVLQEETPTKSVATEPAKNGRATLSEMEVEREEEATENPEYGAVDPEGKQPDAGDDDFMSIDEALGIVAQCKQVKRHTIERISPVLPGYIPILDLTNQWNGADEEDGGVRLQEFGDRSGQQQISETRNFEPIASSPDPITGEPQPQMRAVPRKQSRNDFVERQPSEVPSIMSSPLSSVPSSPPRTLTPPSSLHPPVSEPRATAGFQIVINQAHSPISGTPVISETSPFFERSLRNRKPIQLHPYALEDARYKMQMKSKGVQPVRILEAQEAAAQAAAAEDSQDKEYQALSQEQDNQSPRQRRVGESSTWRKGSTRDDAVNDFVNAVNRVEQRRQKAVARNYTKRRKLAHTFSKNPWGQGGGDPSATQASNFGIDSLRASSISPTRPQHETDVYDFPESPPSLSDDPTGSPLRRSSSNSMPLPATTAHMGSKERGNGPPEPFDYSTDSDIEVLRKSVLNQSSPAGAKISRPRQISTSSNEASASRRNSLGSQVSRAESVARTSDTGSTSETEGSSQGNRPGGPLKVVEFFKKWGTRGVLPASYIKLTEKSKHSGKENGPHRQRRQSTTPPPEERRPGVARAKISSRVREPVQKLFPQESDDDSPSGDEPIITASAPVKARKRIYPPPSSVPSRRVISLLDDGDIPEDNRIDYGLPAPERRRSTAPRAKRKSAKLSGGVARRTNSYANGSFRRRKTRQHSGPRLGIVDAVAHFKQFGDKPPPQFLKVATRSAIARKDLGRQSPGRRLFILDTAEDTRDVQDVLRDWREGTLPFGRTEAPPGRDGTDRSVPLRLPSPRRLGGSGSTEATRFPPFPRARSSAPKPRQTSLLHHHFQRQASSENRGAAHRHESQIRPLAVELPGLQQRPVRHPTSLVIENVIQNLRRQRLRPKAGGFSSTARPDQSVPKRSTVQTLAFPPPPPPMFALGLNNASRGPVRCRKPIPRRIDADTVERRQPPAQDLILDSGDPFEPILMGEQVVGSCLSGLQPFGFKYSLSFDTSPLKDGTIFSSETFIGKGEFSLALNTPCPRVRAAHQAASYNFEETLLHWGVYEDSIATEFEAVMRIISDTAEKRMDGEVGIGLEEPFFAYQAYGFYGFVTKYIAGTLSFHDQLDAVSFAQRFLQTIESFCSRLSLNVSGPTDTEAIRKTNTRLVLQANAFCLVIVFQIFRLTSALPDVHIQLELPRILRDIGRELLSRLLRVGIDKIRACYEDQRRRIQFERGIGSEHFLVELWVLAIQTLDGVGVKGVTFWEIINDELRIDRVENSLDVRTFERLWRTLFSLMPLYQFDNLGLTKRIDDSRPVAENWTMVKVLASRTLMVYNMNKNGHSGTINHYLRIIYARCSHLITKWHWINPDSVIPVLFEFFSNNSLANLPDEDDRGSPDFLLNLDKNPAVDIVDSDQCFHLLLKIIVMGLKRMRATSGTRKISGLVYRLMPNHRRQYPKDEDLRVEHLDALKNHHFLLETLYWAAPPDCRPPLDAIRLLVDPETSHREACTVAIRAWSNILRFQLHSGESLLSMQALMQWFDDLATKTLGQHQLARSEAERQFRLVQETEDSNMSEQDLEANIRRNQRQLEALLNDLVKSLCLELSSVPGNAPNAIVLLTPAATANILNSYTRLSNALLLEVLTLLQQFLKTCKPLEPNSQSNALPANNPDEDSQDYGDWLGFEEVIVQDETKKAADHFLSVAYDSLYRMLSNCFGADIQPEETLLIKLVDTWAATAGFLVQHRFKKWDVYLDYSRESWSSLRDTAQTRKFTAYFLPKVIRSGVDIYQSNKSTFLGSWMRSLVERESMLKFQNEFTATLLDVDSGNPLLDNLPFERDPVTGLFNISQTEFRRRRLPLISSVLERMRETYKAAPSPEAAILKQEYAEMLKAMMKAMKENFEVLQSSTVSGAYVDFVHKVVEFLLQYSTDIVELDKFFTDSSAFPLPAMDPNYVVGQLKKYVFGLSFPGTQKQLNAFFQTLGERAALGNEQDRFVSQLSVALSEDFETGDMGRPTMRAYFLHAIFPAYIETALEHPAGWVLGIPALKALANIIVNLKFNIDSTSNACTTSAISMLATILDSIRRAVNHAMSIENGFSTSHILGTLTLFLRIVAAAIPLLSWLYDDADEAHRETAKDCGDFLIRFAVYARKMVTGRQDDEAQRPLDILVMSEHPLSAFEAGRRHCKDSLVQYLASRWRRDCDGAWVIGDRVAEVPVFPGREGFLPMVVEVVRVAARTEVFAEVAKDVDLQLWKGEGKVPRGVRLEELFF